MVKNNKFCPKGGDNPVNIQGGGILLLGATHTLVAFNGVLGNVGKQINSGGIVVASAHALTKGSNPNFDTVFANTAFRNHPADLIWDGTGVGVRFKANHCGTSIPSGFLSLTHFARRADALGISPGASARLLASRLCLVNGSVHRAEDRLRRACGGSGIGHVKDGRQAVRPPAADCAPRRVGAPLG